MTEIKMPSAGQTTDEATVITIRVNVGDTVKRGDVLMEVETDKATLPVESFVSGVVLDILVQEQERITAGTVLVIVGKKEEAADLKPKKEDEGTKDIHREMVEDAPSLEEKDTYYPILRKKKATPLPIREDVSRNCYPAMPGAKRLAKEMGIDISVVEPSNGQFIKSKDVQGYSSEKAMILEEKEYEILPMTRIRQIIARRMLESKQSIPAWQCTVSINMDNAILLRDVFQKKKCIKLSYNDILVKAVATAARKYRLVNARYEKDEVRVFYHTNIGLAVALEGALVVPVIRGADEKTLSEINATSGELIRKARENKLNPDEMGIGSITISNLGMYDVDQFIAIVNPPESCILAVGSVQVRPKWDGDKFVPAHVMTLTGSFDHRIIDGAYGAQFMQELKALIEAPALMLG